MKQARTTKTRAIQQQEATPPVQHSRGTKAKVLMWVGIPTTVTFEFIGTGTPGLFLAALATGTAMYFSEEIVSCAEGLGIHVPEGIKRRFPRLRIAWLLQPQQPPRVVESAAQPARTVVPAHRHVLPEEEELIEFDDDFDDNAEVSHIFGRSLLHQDEEGDVPAREARLLPSNSGSRAESLARVVTRSAVHELEELLSDALEGFQIYARVLPEVTAVGPRIIQFGVVPTGIPEMQDGQPKHDERGRPIYTKRTRIEEITKREKDIQLSLGAKSIRILSPVPGKHYVGIEIPNPKPMLVALADVLESTEYKQACATSKLVVALGRDVTGSVRFCDIEKAPHILIGGTTNAGKSVLLNVLIASLLSQATPDDVRLMMIDPKQVELTQYNGIAHLLRPVITSMAEVVPMLEQAVGEMERRYQIFAALGVRKLADYRKKRESRPDLENLPAWVIIIDEFADLMMTAPTETEEKVCRLAQKARATGIHLVIATQKPVVKVITGLIKGNLPTSIALKTKTEVDSRVILDQGGAERLLGDGDMLYLPPNTEEPIRIQGAYMTDDEAESIISYWRGESQDHTETDVVPSQPLDVETLVGWWRQGQINDEQLLTLMEKVSGRVTDELEEGTNQRPGLVPNLRVLRPEAGTPGDAQFARTDGQIRDRGLAPNGYQKGRSEREHGAYQGTSPESPPVLKSGVNALVEEVPMSPFVAEGRDRIVPDDKHDDLAYFYAQVKDVKKALGKIGLGHDYYRHASWILENRGLKARRA